MRGRMIRTAATIISRERGNKKTDAADKFVPHGKSSEICGVAAFGKTENRHQKNGQDKCRQAKARVFSRGCP